MKVGILVTAIGSFSGNAIIASLKKMKEFYVFGCDIHPSIWHTGSAEYKKVFRVPKASDAEVYISAIIRICEDHEIKFIIPTIDVEIDVYNLNRNIFKERNIILCIPGSKTISVARNKYNLSTFFKENSYFKTIHIYRSVTEVIENPTFPYVAKLFNGRSSEGLKYIYDIEELELVFNRGNYIVQPFIPGDNYTVDYIRNSASGTDYSVSRHELLRTSNGAGITVRMIHDPFLSEAASFIGRKINVNGCVNYEFIKAEDEYYLMDINPRFSAGIAFTAKIGYDLVKSHLNCFRDKDIEKPVEYPEMIIVKSYIETIMSVEKE